MAGGRLPIWSGTVASALPPFPSSATTRMARSTSPMSCRGSAHEIVSRAERSSSGAMPKAHSFGTDSRSVNEGMTASPSGSETPGASRAATVKLEPSKR